MATSLPQELVLFDILPRLPIKSTSRFMCVSKELYSFLSSDMFKKMHNRYLDRHQNPEKLLVVSGTSPHMFGTLDCEAPDSGLLPSRFRIPFDLEGKTVELLTSYHGLVCLGIIMDCCTHVYSDLILWNPLTSDYKTLFNNSSHEGCYYRDNGTFGLFYSSCEDDYKLVRLTDLNHVYIYSLKSDSWRIVDSIKPDIVTYLNGGLGSICLNGNIYFKFSGRKNSVTRFDTNTEKFKVIKAPFVGSFNKYKKHATLMVQRGCLHFCIMINDGWTCLHDTCIQLWKMVEDGCWNKVVTYHLDGYDIRFLTPLHLMTKGKLFILDVHSLPSALYEVDLVKVKHSKKKDKWWRNGKLLMLNYLNRIRRALYEVDLKKKKLDEKEDTWCKLVSTDNSDQLRYTETFVSPNLYIK